MERPFRTPFFPVVPILGIVTSLYLVFTLPRLTKEVVFGCAAARDRWLREVRPDTGWPAGSAGPSDPAPDRHSYNTNFERGTGCHCLSTPT
jgi:hypothetical protein